MSRKTDIVLVIAIMVISAIPRLTGLGRFTSIDEPFWLRQSANFYYALGQREFENTIYEYHPAVTTMWIITAGMLAYFPEYRAMDQGYLKPGKFDLFLLTHGKNPLQLLIASRVFQILIIVFLLAVVYLLLRLLFDRPSAFLTTLLVSLSPFLLGHSRLLNHEAMLGLFLLVSLLSMLAYIKWKQKTELLAISAAAGALAQLSKSSGILLFPLIFILLIVYAFEARSRTPSARVLDTTRILGTWLVITAGSYVLFWPGMWVAPGKMLSEVYGNALAYTFQGARLSVLPSLEPGVFHLDTLGTGLIIYMTDLLWRTTPLTWLGVILGIGFTIAAHQTGTLQNHRLVVLYTMLLAAAFVLMFSIQRGPKPPHYILTSFVCLDVVAGLGLSRLWFFATRNSPQLSTPGLMMGILGCALALQLASSMTFYPYYMSYYNPLLEGVKPGMQNPSLAGTGYGVGLDQAAAYLSGKPDAKQLTVLSSHGLGSFSYYFSGHTVPMNNLTLSDPEIVRILRTSQYAVVDYYNQERSNLAGELDGVSPEKIIMINGVDFLHIYRASDLIAHVDHIGP